MAQPVSVRSAAGHLPVICRSAVAVLLRLPDPVAGGDALPPVLGRLLGRVRPHAVHAPAVVSLLDLLVLEAVVPLAGGVPEVAGWVAHSCTVGAAAPNRADRGAAQWRPNRSRQRSLTPRSPSSSASSRRPCRPIRRPLWTTTTADKVISRKPTTPTSQLEANPASSTTRPTTDPASPQSSWRR